MYFIYFIDEFNSDELEKSEDILKKCNCLPGCKSLAYNAETTQTDFNYVKVFGVFGATIEKFPG